jgi:hypothetical protein
MLGAGFSRLHGEFVKALRFVLHMLAAAETINRQPHGFVGRSALCAQRHIVKMR